MSDAIQWLLAVASILLGASLLFVAGVIFTALVFDDGDNRM